jgi:hypothetical protein
MSLASKKRCKFRLLSGCSDDEFHFVCRLVRFRWNRRGLNCIPKLRNALSSFLRRNQRREGAPEQPTSVRENSASGPTRQKQSSRADRLKISMKCSNSEHLNYRSLLRRAFFRKVWPSRVRSKNSPVLSVDKVCAPCQSMSRRVRDPGNNSGGGSDSSCDRNIRPAQSQVGGSMLFRKK